MKQLKRRLKQIFVLALTVAIISNTVDLAGFAVFAETTGQQTEEGRRESATRTIIPSVELPDNDELFAGYVDKTFYGGISLYGMSAGNRLTPGPSKNLYDYLKAEIEKVARGSSSSTVFTINDLKSLGAKTSFSNMTSDDAFDELIAQFEISKVIDALLHDCPYELYWFDKTSGVNYGCDNIMVTGTAPTYTTVDINSLMLSFQVAGTYQVPGYSQDAPAVNASLASATGTAAANAQSIVTSASGKSDYEKLTTYSTAICNMVTYDNSAAESGNFAQNDNPWQLIYVFDNDSSTNVVCEGYAKAFQYLCDLSTFSNGVFCYTVSGNMNGATGGGGPHMWNIVTMEDGKNYLVDVTNSDTGTVGQNGGLFLAGTSGSVAGGYTFAVGAGVAFTYDDDSITLWGTDADSILTLATSDYEPKAAVELVIDDTPTNYSDIATAINAANAAAGSSIVVRLNRSAELTADVSINNNVALNLNGNTLTVPTGRTLTISSESSVSGGTLSGAGTFVLTGGTPSGINVPTNLVYTGNDLTDNAKASISLNSGTKTICGVNFNNQIDTAGWGEPTFSYGGSTVAAVQNAGTYTVTYTNNNDSNKTLSATFTVAPASLNGAQVAVSGDYYYTGSAIEPADIVVTIGGKTLVSGTDYTASFSNNTEAGKATVTITGRGNYSGTAVGEFTINKTKLKINSVTFEDGTTTKTYDGTTDGPVVKTITFAPVDGNGTNIAGSAPTLTLGKDYTATAAFDSAAAGDNKNINVDVKLTDIVTNYELFESDYSAGNGAYAITPATITITADDVMILVNGTVPDTAALTYKVSGLIGNDTEAGVLTTKPTLSYETTPDSTQENTYKINISGAGTNGNYTIIYIYGTLTVTSKYNVSDQLALTANNIIYGNAPDVKATFGGKADNNITYTYSGDNGTSYKAFSELQNGEGLLPVGTYIVKATYEDATQKGEKTATFHVDKATPNVKAIPTVADRIYNPTISLVNTDLTGGSVTGVDGAALEGAWSWNAAGTIPNVNNSGYVAVFTPKDAVNYNMVSKTITVKVTPATPYIVTAPSASEITYGSTLSASTLTGGSAQYGNGAGAAGNGSGNAEAVQGSFAWKDTNIKPTVTDSNTTAYTVVFTPAELTNYSTAEITITLKVNKAQNAPNMPGSTLSVDNKCEKIGDVTSLPTGWEWQDADKNTALTVGVPVNATAVYTGADKDNYVNITVKIAVTRSQCDHVVGDILYTGQGDKAPTCTEAGTGHTECTKCHQTVQSGIAVNALGHTGGSATCSGKAVCTRCNQEYGSLNSAKHASTEIRGYKKATCTEKGYTGDTYCKSCNTKTISGTTTAALGHDYVSTVTKEPTTEKEGIRTYTCSRCKNSYTRSISKLEEEKHKHEYSSKVTKHPTCTDAGEITYTCSCDDSYTESIAKTSHIYKSEVTRKATVNQQGEMTYTCSKCGNTYTKAIEKLKAAKTEDKKQEEKKQDDKSTDKKTDKKDDKPNVGEPFIREEDSKQDVNGWDAIAGKVKKTKDENTVVVDMNGATVVQGDILNSIKDRDVTVLFDMGNDVTWSVNGREITSDNVGDIDFSVTVGTEDKPLSNIPDELLSRVTENRYFRNVSLVFEGEFGLVAELSVDMGAENAGLIANLFYYDEEAGELVFVGLDEIAEDGIAELGLVHASEYTIVVDKNSMEGFLDTEEVITEAQEDVEVFEEADSNDASDEKTDSNTGNENTEQENTENLGIFIMVIGVVVIAAGLGVFLFIKKKK